MPIPPTVRREADAREFDTVERCAIIEVSNTTEDPEVSIARARVAPGVTTAWHKLRGTAERYLIISGQGVAQVGSQVREAVAAGDVVLIPPDAAQRICNTGTQDLIFYAICTPRFDSGCYETLE